MNILQEIFSDHYEEIIYTLHPRYSIIENVDKMINCGNPRYGGVMWGCEKCGNLKFVPFRCKSRFCPTCGNKYSIDRTLSMSSKIINAQHRHCVFTIDDSLRHFFLEDRDLLNCLFSAVRSVVLRMFHKDNKTELFTPGFISVLHTFGRDLKWNPHIHCLISEGGIGNSGLWRAKNHFDYKFLRYAFRTVLLNELEVEIGPSFKQAKSACYRNHESGFYVYAKPRKCNPSEVLKYIGRYLGRPVIATSRIDSYDRENDTVTFHYNRHEDEKYMVETIPAMDFIKRLIRHIPEKHFKMIRYYGIYARHRDVDKNLHRAMSSEKHRFWISFNRWRSLFLCSMGYDPLKCPCCGQEMVFLEMYHKRDYLSLEEMYERAMAKTRRSRSPTLY